MINPGLYKVEFRNPMGFGRGVVVLTEGKFRGGDAAFYYVGTYTEDGDKFSATVQVKRHSPGQQGLMGENTTFTVQGTSTGNAASLAGKVPAMPGATFQAHIERLSD